MRSGPEPSKKPENEVLAGAVLKKNAMAGPEKASKIDPPGRPARDQETKEKWNFDPPHLATQKHYQKPPPKAYLFGAHPGDLVF